MENAQVNKAGSLLEPLTGSDSPAREEHFRWRSQLESIVIPIGAILVSLAAFGAFCALAGANPSAVYASIYKAAFGSWYSFQNTLVRAAPLMLCSLGTAIPFQLGLVMIGNEGALVIGGLCATIAGLQFPTASPLMVQVVMAGVGMMAGGLWLAISGAIEALPRRQRNDQQFADELHRDRASEPGHQYLDTRSEQSEQTRQLSDPG